MSSNAKYCEETEGWIFQDNYDWDAIEQRLIDHFNDGGNTKRKVLAAVCHTSPATLYRWLDKGGEWYREQISQVIDKYEANSALRIDKEYRKAGRGDLERYDSQILREQHQQEVRESDKLNLSKATRDALAGDDIKHQLTCLRKDLTRNRITLAQFETLSKTLNLKSDATVQTIEVKLDATQIDSKIQTLAAEIDALKNDV